MAIQLKRTSTTPSDEQLSSLLIGQPLVNLETGDIYVGGCCDGRPVNAPNLLNATDTANNPNGGLLQYGGDKAASAGSPAVGRVGNTATGTYAIALGKYVHSDVRNAITLGYTSVNKSEYGTVIGRGNYSEGSNSVVIGKFNTNKGKDNYIIGAFNDINNANGCYLFGSGLTATTGNNFVIGSNNDSSHNNGHDIFQIGDGWGSGAAGTKDEKFNLVTVLKRVRDSEGRYSYGGYMEITIQGNTPNSVIKKSTMDTAISRVDTKVDELEENLSEQLQEEKTARENADTTLQEEIEEVVSKVEQHNNDYIGFLETYLQTVYPVGSIYMSVLDTNPSTLFGGTWEAWGAGRVPVGVSVEDADFNTVEYTGGSKQCGLPGHSHSYTYKYATSTDGHTLTTSEMPEHQHRYIFRTETGLANAGSFSWTEASSTDYTSSYTETAGGNQSHSHTITNSTYQGNTGSAGTTSTNGNLQPYITCYMWKRTA